MIKSTNEKVQQFIDEIMMLEDTKYQILERLRSIVFEYYPEVKERMMYGGIIFSLADDWGGVFVYKNHVSFEFSFGIHLKDPEKVLEGKGKFRRHLKMTSMEDIESKNAGFFVQQIQGLD